MDKLTVRPIHLRPEGRSFFGREMIKNIIREELHTQLHEELDRNDIEEIKDIIRAEIASVMFTLFKKRSIWL